MNHRYIVSAILIGSGIFAITQFEAILLGLFLIGSGLFVIIWALLKIGIMLALLAASIYFAFEIGAIEAIREFVIAGY